MNSYILPNLNMMVSPATAADLMLSSDAVQGEIHKWDHFVNEPDDQGNTGTCAARAECGRAEVLINSALGNQFYGEMQLDAIKVYSRAFELRYPWKKVDLNSGVYLIDPTNACIDLGIYPKDTVVERIEVLPFAVAQALDDGPLTLAQNVTKGWQSENMNKETGEIASYPSLSISGHGVLGIGVNIGTTGTVLVSFVNSWSKDKWGWHGLGQIPFEGFRYNSLDNPILVRIDPSWWRLSSRWKDFVVHAPNGVIPLR